MSVNGEGVNYSVKELLAMLERTLTSQLESIQQKLDHIEERLAEKADRAKVHAVEARIAALELVALRHGGPIDLEVQRQANAIRALELSEAGREALSNWQRWFFGFVCVGLISALATIAWLLTG